MGEQMTAAEIARHLLTAEDAQPDPVAIDVAHAFATLAVADELAAIRVGLGRGMLDVASTIPPFMAALDERLGAVERLADALERLGATGRVPVDATLRSAPEERLAGPAGA